MLQWKDSASEIKRSTALGSLNYYLSSASQWCGVKISSVSLVPEMIGHSSSLDHLSVVACMKSNRMNAWCHLYLQYYCQTIIVTKQSVSMQNLHDFSSFFLPRFFSGFLFLSTVIKFTIIPAIIFCRPFWITKNAYPVLCLSR